MRLLITKGHTVAAPMLKSDGLYSNFWCGMTEEYYYLRTEDYKPILQRERIGCFHVPMVHSSVLIDLRRASSNGLTFVSSEVPDYKGPHDDIITFAIAANKSGMYRNGIFYMHLLMYFWLLSCGHYCNFIVQCVVTRYTMAI